MTVLVVAPTAWNAAAFAGGAMLRWVRADRPTVLAVPAGAADAVMAEVAGLLDAKAVHVPWSEPTWSSDEDGRVALTEVFREVTPELVLAPPTSGSHERARALGRMVFDASFCATVPHFMVPSGRAAGGSRTSILEFDDPFRAGRSPIEYVDTSPVWDDKAQAIRASTSDPGLPAWLPAGSVIDPFDVAEVVSRTRGLQIQAVHGEAVTQVRVYGRLRAERAMP